MASLGLSTMPWRNPLWIIQDWRSNPILPPCAFACVWVWCHWLTVHEQLVWWGQHMCQCLQDCCICCHQWYQQVAHSCLLHPGSNHRLCLWLRFLWFKDFVVRKGGHPCTLVNGAAGMFLVYAMVLACFAVEGIMRVGMEVLISVYQC